METDLPIDWSFVVFPILFVYYFIGNWSWLSKIIFAWISTTEIKLKFISQF